MAWLARHAGGGKSRLQIGEDDKTAYQRLKGRRLFGEWVEFGECVWFLLPKSLGRSKAESRWGDGVWLGFRDESNEVFIGTLQGVVKGRTVRRKGTEKARWDPELFRKGNRHPMATRTWKEWL